MGERSRRKAANQLNSHDNTAWRTAERKSEPEQSVIVAGKGITSAGGNAVATIEGKKFTIRRDEAPLLSLAKLEYEQYLDGLTEGAESMGFRAFLQDKVRSVEDKRNSPTERALEAMKGRGNTGV